MLLLVDLGNLGGEVRGVAVAEFLHGVHAGGLEQLGELRADALDAEQVRMVHPREDEVVTDAGGLLDFLAALRGGAFLKQLGDGLNTGGDELLSVDRADTLDVDDLVSQIKICV